MSKEEISEFLRKVRALNEQQKRHLEYMLQGALFVAKTDEGDLKCLHLSTK